jgi:hypothetical protein
MIFYLLIDDLSTKSGVPVVIRKDLTDGVSIIAETDRTRLAPRPNTSFIDGIRFESRVYSNTTLVPLMINLHKLAQEEERRNAISRGIFITILIIVSPAIIWCGLGCSDAFKFSKSHDNARLGASARRPHKLGQLRRRL